MLLFFIIIIQCIDVYKCINDIKDTAGEENYSYLSKRKFK